MLAIAGPGREASEKSNLGSIEAAALSSAGLGIFDAAALSSAGLGFIEAAALPSAGLGLIEVAALPSAGCQCLCLPNGPTVYICMCSDDYSRPLPVSTKNWQPLLEHPARLQRGLKLPL